MRTGTGDVAHSACETGIVRAQSGAHCAGVDGCPGGWVVATRSGVHVVESIAEVIDHGYAVVAIDMPIGMPTTAARRSELEARRFLTPRGSTIFPTPPRVCLQATDYRQACELSFAARGVKLSKQSWHILSKIADVDRAVTPEHSNRVVEAHPECSFLTMNDGRRLTSKHSPTGRVERAGLIEEMFGIQPVRVGVAALDDVLDAYAVLWTAERFAVGVHESFPESGEEFDERGLPMRIVR